MIWKMAIVEDEPDAADRLTGMIERYRTENCPSDEYKISVFSGAYDFLAKKETYDVIFLDIQMEGMNGMQVAREIRKYDENVLILFVTNMAQYAVESYDVRAYDFILKPLTYGNFFMKFRRVLKALAHKENDCYVTLSSRFEQRRVSVNDIIYVEVSKHDLSFHTADGDMHMTGTMADWESRLAPYHFVRCNTYLLVNLGYVTRIYGDEVTVGGKILRVSRSKKQQLMNEFAKYMGGSK